MPNQVEQLAGVVTTDTYKIGFGQMAQTGPSVYDIPAGASSAGLTVTNAEAKKTYETARSSAITPNRLAGPSRKTSATTTANVTVEDFPFPHAGSAVDLILQSGLRSPRYGAEAFTPDGFGVWTCDGFSLATTGDELASVISGQDLFIQIQAVKVRATVTDTSGSRVSLSNLRDWTTDAPVPNLPPIQAGNYVAVYGAAYRPGLVSVPLWLEEFISSQLHRRQLGVEVDSLSFDMGEQHIGFTAAMKGRDQNEGPTAATDYAAPPASIIWALPDTTAPVGGMHHTGNLKLEISNGLAAIPDTQRRGPAGHHAKELMVKLSGETLLYFPNGAMSSSYAKYLQDVKEGVTIELKHQNHVAVFELVHGVYTDASTGAKGRGELRTESFTYEVEDTPAGLDYGFQLQFIKEL